MSKNFPQAAVLGCPIGHSKSHRIHRHWLKRYGLSGDYGRIEVQPGNLAAAVRGLIALDFQGCNVTLPHKEAALALADTASDAARKIGASNTLVFRDGKVHADNTDAYGFVANLRAGAPDWAAKGSAMVLGAGGAARAVIFGLIEAGVEEIYLANRSLERAEQLAAEMSAHIKTIPLPATPNVDLLINSTSLGMVNQPPLDIDLSQMPDGAIVTDLVYAPLETELLRAARARGLQAVDGLGMLLHQAAPGFEAWFGQRPEVDAALRAEVLQ